MAALALLQLYTTADGELPLLSCDLNRSMQHLISHYGEGDVENEVKTADLLFRCTQGIDVGSVAAPSRVLEQ